jgi:nucleoporin POM152
VYSSCPSILKTTNFKCFYPCLTHTDYFHFDLAILEHRIRLRNLVDPATHILGSVTIHILPHSTAKLILQDVGSCYCVSSPPSNEDPALPFPLFSQSRAATIPVLLNNTTPKYLQYSLQEFGEPFESRNTFNLTSKDLKQIASYKSQRRRKRGVLDYDTFDEELEEEEEFDFASGSGNTIGQRLIGYDGTYDSDSARGTSVDSPAFPGSARENAFLRYVELEKTQAIWSFNVQRPGIIRIERIIDKSDADVRIPAPSSENAKIIVVPCPSARFHQDDQDKQALRIEQKQGKKAGKSSALDVTQTACQNDAEDKARTISVDVFGFPPLKLAYSRQLGKNNKRETYTIDGIAPDGAILASHSQKGSTKARKLPVSPGAAAAPGQQLILGHEAPHGPVLKPQVLNVPLNMSLSVVGAHQYTLDFSALRDRFGAAPSPDYPTKGGKASSSLVSSKTGASSQAIGGSLQLAASKSIMVYPRSQVSFFGCGTGAVGSASHGSSTRSSSGSGTAGQPVKLLRGGNANLQLRAGSLATAGTSQSNTGNIDDSPWTVEVQFEPDTPDTADTGAIVQSKGWKRQLTLSSSQELLQVDQPGKYRIVSIKGAHCGGEVFEPSEVSTILTQTCSSESTNLHAALFLPQCSVYTPALPTADLSLEPITDSCAGEVGLKATFSLSGEPPYRVHYSIQHGSSRPVKKTKTVRLSREEIELRPDDTGEFTYQFLSVDDANYNGIEIGKTVKQTVHPLAGVSFANAGKGQKVWSCEGDEIQVPIMLKVRNLSRTSSL